MTNAIITTTNSAIGSQSVFLGSLTTAMQSAGFTLLDSYDASGNQARLYSRVVDASKTYGTMIIQIAFTGATTVTIRGFATWDTAGNTGTGASTVTSKDINPAFSRTLHICNHPEVRGVIIGSEAFIGYFRPSTVTIDENSFPFGFISDGAPGSFQFSSANELKPISSLHPWASTQLEMIDVRVTQIDPVRGNARLIIPAAIARENNSIAEFSSDCVLGASNGMNILDVFQVTPGVEEYQLFDGSGNPSTFTRFAVRVV